jgi:hypothetical protein
MKRISAKPEFCPNPACRFYNRTAAATHRWYIHFGKFYTQCRGWITRFRCRFCGKTCSTQTFSVHYWTHSTNDLVWLMHHLGSSSGLRQIGRYSGLSYRVIQNRVRRLARNSLSVMDEVLSNLNLSESLVMDGFESYTRSHYHPNNFTTIVGSDSQFFYAVIHTLLRRKGAMSEHQKSLRALIDSVWQPPSHGIRDDCTTVLTDVSALIGEAVKRREQLCLYTDRHTAYPQALKRVAALAALVEQGRLIHHRISSRAARTVYNPLFPVNYLDRQIRKNMGEHVRETVKQGREVNCQMERMVVFMFMHNFLTPHRIDDTARVDRSERHARYAAIHSAEVVQRIKRFLTHRHIWGHGKVKHQWMKRIWQHEYKNPPVVRVKKGKLWVHSVALPPGGLPAHFLA